MPRKSKVSTEKKVELVTLYIKGEIGISAVGEIAGVAVETIHQWITGYEAEEWIPFF